ncbi:hypothetical protein D3C87_2019720 [compost metagenome]
MSPSTTLAPTTRMAYVPVNWLPTRFLIEPDTCELSILMPEPVLDGFHNMPSLMMSPVR